MAKIDNNLCFVISPIGKKRSKEYKLFKEILDHIIKPTVHSSGMDLKVVRADDIQKPGSIIRDIIIYLHSSRVVIADLTGKNPNVFYELGVRHSLAPRTILIAQDISDVPSDLQDFRVITYSTSSPEDINNFSCKLKSYLKDIANDPYKPDNPVFGYLQESKDELVKGYAPVIKRRWLAYAMHGLPSSAVVKEVAQHLTKPDPEYKTILELPAVLASTLQLRNTFIFRQNTTQAIRDCLEAVLRHELWHHSRRGEEGADITRLARGDSSFFSDPVIVPVGDLIYSDVDHPAITHMVKQIWPESALNDPVGLSDIILCNDYTNDNYSSPVEEILQRYLEVISDTHPSVVIVPHIVWLNGATLNVKYICKEIKRQYPLVTTLVDGAQAPGHIPIQIETLNQENNDIDFYVAGGHKWLCGPESIGFARIGYRYNEECQQCRQFLVTSDQLTDASSLPLSYRGVQSGTQQRGLGKGLLCTLREFSETREEHYKKINDNAVRLRKLLGKKSELKILGPPEEMRSGIVTVTTDSGSGLIKLFKKMKEAKFQAVLYDIPQGISCSDSGLIMRLSPGPELDSSDLTDLDLLFEIK